LLLLGTLAIIAIAAVLFTYIGLKYYKPHIPPAIDTVTVPIPAGEKRVFAIIIDDLGHSPGAAKPFLDMVEPVALSVLPGRPFSRSIAVEGHNQGKTILMHLPMEPEGYPLTDPGEGAILLNHSKREIKEIIASDLDMIPYASGVNNHMGSRATKEKRVMESVLNQLKDRGLFFIDSRTTRESVAFKLARNYRIPAGERDVFLDNDQQPEAIEEMIKKLLDIAEEKGWAIGIGHPYQETARALAILSEEARRRQIEWVSIEELLPYADTRN